MIYLRYFHWLIMYMMAYVCKQGADKILDEEINLTNRTVVVTSHNVDRFEMTSTEQPPSINCYMAAESNNIPGGIQWSWEYCAWYSKSVGVTSTVHPTNHISLHMKQFPDPGKYCYRCVIHNKDGQMIYRSKKILVAVQDTICYTPPRSDIGVGTDILLCMFIDEPDKKCQRHTVESLDIVDRVNDAGESEVILLWKKPHQNIDTVYGYRFKIAKLYQSYYVTPFEACLVTKYGSFTKGLKITTDENYTYYSIFMRSIDAINRQNQVTEENSDGYTYKFLIWCLPLSNTEMSTTVKLRTREDLCLEYVQKHKKIPERCFPFQNITVQSGCITDGELQSKSIKLSWVTRADWKSANNGRVNKTHIKIHVGSLGLHIYRPVNDTSIDIPLEGDTSSFGTYSHISFIRICLKCDQEHVTETYIYLPSCPTQPPTPNVTMTHNKNGGEAALKNPMIIASAIAVFATILIVAFIVYQYQRVKKDVSKMFLKTSPLVEYHEQQTICPEGEAAVELVEDTPITVMLVHPHGCKEVENLVVFLASQLNTFGINVLSDIMQAELVAEQSLPNVLMSNFNSSDYIVVLCTEQTEQKKLPCHQPYEFVLNQLISNACVYGTAATTNNHGKNKDCNRFLAVHFSSPTTIPPHQVVPSYLLPRSHQLPHQLSAFVQNLFGMKTHFSYLYNKIFEQNVPQYLERKQQLKTLALSLNDAVHTQCYSTTCRKGTLSEKVDDDLSASVLITPNMGDGDSDIEGWSSNSSEDENENLAPVEAK